MASILGSRADKNPKGILGGIAVSTFSKPLAFLIGLMVLCVQACSLDSHWSSGAATHLQQYLHSKGFGVIPTARLQRYVTSIDLRSAIENDVAFKLSFGLTFMLAAFAEF
jgi:hypothetical protein